MRVRVCACAPAQHTAFPSPSPRLHQPSARAHTHLEAGPLSSACLLLDGHDLHDLVLQSRAQEVVHNLALLDGHGEQVNLLQALNLALRDDDDSHDEMHTR